MEDEQLNLACLQGKLCCAELVTHTPNVKQHAISCRSGYRHLYPDLWSAQRLERD